MAEELKNPIAFQCIECSTILTDSFFLTERMNDFLIFTKAPNVKVEEEVLQSTNESDSLCSYHLISCLCGKSLGRKYLTVSTSMSSCLGSYAIQIKDIRGYQLGVSSPGTEQSFMTNAEINSEIIRLQKFCTYLYGKIKESK
ncbi:hypothetical protein NEHOM01_0800 [Nematocida homosporus]|uniref:uncharacterized protein n=1 Tax=Nematocida homosporus TaxID=1912981 RepID=UPI00221F0740|nr:uncharacterized protein NEHOM01_0800 [Nematocida homosporus]KAI5185385.1 hypothetical protein NEHOM01_0800 [Nematocida homosporus]